MRIIKPFAAITPGEYDNFAFDFTERLDGASIVSTSWSCVVRTPGPSGAIDLAPQGHITNVSAQLQIMTDEGSILSPGGVMDIIETGGFSVALVGGFTVPQIGATYTLAATVVTNDGRTLSLSADLPIGMS